MGAVEGRAGRDHPNPQVLISLGWYAYRRGISSGRARARRGESEPAFPWRCGREPIRHRTLAGFRSDPQAALDDRFAPGLGRLSAEGLLTLERGTLDGTKIKAKAGGNTFRRQETRQAHRQGAREQVRWMEKPSAEEAPMAQRQVGARRRAARQRRSRLQAAVREGERFQRQKKDDRESFVARASSPDPEAHGMRKGEGGTVPSDNVQRLTDAAPGLIVKVEATPAAVDHRQRAPALKRCAPTLGRRPEPLGADGDYTPHASVAAAANSGVDFYGSWQESGKPGERAAQGRRAAFLARAFPDEAEKDGCTCPAGELLTPQAIQKRAHGVRVHVYRPPRQACRTCA
jgi:hypothetical protein